MHRCTGYFRGIGLLPGPVRNAPDRSANFTSCGSVQIKVDTTLGGALSLKDRSPGEVVGTRDGRYGRIQRDIADGSLPGHRSDGLSSQA